MFGCISEEPRLKTRRIEIVKGSEVYVCKDKRIKGFEVEGI